MCLAQRTSVKYENVVWRVGTLIDIDKSWEIPFDMTERTLFALKMRGEKNEHDYYTKTQQAAYTRSLRFKFF